VRVSVSDNGKGIAAHDLPHIFERYWRSGQADPAGVHPSAGLGLAIVKRILDLHGSAVQVSSELARGTRFEFVLPHEDRAGAAA
jgi:signal transduction histidine kinase